MTVTVNLSLELEQFVSERIASGEFSNADEVVRVALTRLAEDQFEAAHTEALLREAEESGDYIEWNEAEWKSIEREAMEMFEHRKKTGK
jgi:putative addiction module CopG family antidote